MQPLTLVNGAHAFLVTGFDEARAVMVEGVSGILSVARRQRHRVKWEPSLGKLTWPRGTVAQLFAGDNADGLRGPEHHVAWCDELAKWRQADGAWDNLQMGLRAGPRPRALVTTTPRSIKLINRIAQDSRTVKTGGRTSDNISLPRSFVDVMMDTYGGSRIGQQELDGVLIADSTGDLRLVDPFTGASDVLLAGSQRTALVGWGVALDDMRVLWQPVGESALYLRLLGEGTDLALDIDPALIDSEAAVEPWWQSSDGLVLTLTDPQLTRISAAVRTDTGAAIVVPQHVDHDYLYGNALGLSLADGDVRVEAIWEPATGALREWYRGPAPVPYLHAVDGDHADYIVPDSTLPDERALWRVDLDSGERRLLLARMGSVMSVVDTDKYVMKFDLPAPGGNGALFDIDYVDITTADHTLIAGSVSDAVEVPGEGVLYLDAHGEQPGVWVAPLP